MSRRKTSNRPIDSRSRMGQLKNGFLSPCFRVGGFRTPGGPRAKPAVRCTLRHTCIPTARHTEEHRAYRVGSDGLQSARWHLCANDTSMRAAGAGLPAVNRCPNRCSHTHGNVRTITLVERAYLQGRCWLPRHIHSPRRKMRREPIDSRSRVDWLSLEN